MLAITSLQTAPFQVKYGIYAVQKIEFRDYTRAKRRVTVFTEPITGDACENVSASVAARRLLLPYNVVRTGDGVETLFNREYNPLWSRRDGGRASRVTDRTRWQDHGTTWFYGDATPEPERVAAGRKVCAAWGIDLPAKLADLIVTA